MQIAERSRSRAGESAAASARIAGVAAEELRLAVDRGVQVAKEEAASQLIVAENKWKSKLEEQVRSHQLHIRDLEL